MEKAGSSRSKPPLLGVNSGSVSDGVSVLDGRQEAEVKVDGTPPPVGIVIEDGSSADSSSCRRRDIKDRHLPSGTRAVDRTRRFVVRRTDAPIRKRHLALGGVTGKEQSAA